MECNIFPNQKFLVQTFYQTTVNVTHTDRLIGQVNFLLSNKKNRRMRVKWGTAEWETVSRESEGLNPITCSILFLSVKKLDTNRLACSSLKPPTLTTVEK